MGQRFQIYVNYGKTDETGKVGGNLFAMHLQWSWGHFSSIRAHQLVDFLDGARQNAFNPFGLGEYGRLGGNSFDGRREDLYLLRALTEINSVFSSIVEGHDLMAESHENDEWLFRQGDIASVPNTIQLNPLEMDNDDGFLVIQATESEVKYAFCRDTSAIEPIDASEYMDAYRSELQNLDDKTRTKVEAIVESLKGYPLLTKDEMERIFEKSYDKKLNLENYQEPEREMSRHEPLNEVVAEAKTRTDKRPQAPLDEQTQNQNAKKQRDERSR